MVALATAAAPGCVNFHTVEKGQVYRSAQPDEQQLTHWIWRYGIETVVRLRGGTPGRADFESSYEPTVDAGIDFVHLKLRATHFPRKEQLVGICDILENARYPILIHCRAGADRTSLVSAIYVLESTGDLDRAREQLALIPYMHLGWFGADKADLVIDMYEPWQGKMSFCEWARSVYERPDADG